MWNPLNPDRLYRNDILSWRAWELRLSHQAIARLSDVRGPTVARVMKGESCGVKTLWAIADALNIRREALLDLRLKEHQFPAAVVNGKRR